MTRHTHTHEEVTREDRAAPAHPTGSARRRRLIAAAGAIVAMSMALAGCGLGVTTNTDGTGTNDASTGDPTFTGAWAEDFRLQYDGATAAGNTFAQDVLRDGSITEAEATEAAGRFKSCMADAGYHYDYVNPDGGMQMQGGDWSDTEEQRHRDAEQACDESSGMRWISALYAAVLKDPDGELRDRDPEQANHDLAACLKRHGVVGDDFDESTMPGVDESGDTAYRFNQQFTEPGGKYYSAQSEQLYYLCLADPRQ
ncbi:hypothetical protein JS528_01570 [Bifidobacterium sp. MA2]|uniref:Lipoprotein n=1 Tax=Bifidobacterium santillanense TaxID=2809028 RepID=A0ABS5UMD7_9BIFI|nr:hypothetical protein [Bifidobacterium santillanense]MBT1172070.1 hypothetical protein [Bifidobacterium santillanense]